MTHHAGHPESKPLPLAEEDDRTLAARVASGERAAFEQLMRRYNRRLYRLARATLRDDAEAEDALQEAYLAAFRAIPRFRGDASLSTWLSRLVLNECLTRQRRGARRDTIAPMVGLSTIADFERETMDADHNESPDRALMRTELRTLLERKLDALPEAFRIVFVMRCVEEFSVEETAECPAYPRRRCAHGISVQGACCASRSPGTSIWPSAMCFRSTGNDAIASCSACWRKALRVDLAEADRRAIRPSGWVRRIHAHPRADR